MDSIWKNHITSVKTDSALCGNHITDWWFTDVRPSLSDG